MALRAAPIVNSGDVHAPKSWTLRTAATMGAVLVASLFVLSCATHTRRRRRFLPHDRRRRSPEELLEEVRLKSKGVLYMVSTAKNDKFSIPNLKKYLQKKGIPVHEGSTDEENILTNAERLLEYLERDDAHVPAPGMPLLKHELVHKAISPEDLQSRFPAMKAAYLQQPLDYGRNSRYGDNWRISCYLVVMDSWKPKIEAHGPMVQCMGPVMDMCVDGFRAWHCRRRALASIEVSVMNAFVTKYSCIDGEDQLKKHIDGANVDGSVILALPTDYAFEGGTLHVWDRKPEREFVYQMQVGDTIYLDNGIWHQAKPITSGTRWALVLFLRLRNSAPSADVGEAKRTTTK